MHETVSSDRVLNDLDKALRRIDLDSLDVVTFSGIGEPTLNPNLEDIASSVKERIGRLPMVILTNASMFHRNDVRRALTEFDMVVAKLDAGDDETFHSINRPINPGLSIGSVIDSIKKLGEETEGRIALEVMLLDSEGEQPSNIQDSRLQSLLKAIFEINPEIVQLLVPYRPPSESFVRVPSPERMKLISDELSEVLGEERLWVYGTHDRRGKSVRRLSLESLEEDVVELLRRRPCRDIDIASSLMMNLSDARQLLRELEERNLVVSERRGGENYYSYRK